jgi:hypothetical protein
MSNVIQFNQDNADRKIKIDKEFKALIPALSKDELAQLTENIKTDGVCREPLILWNDILVDGHNRYSICTKHNIPYSTSDRSFNSRDDARVWIINNQLGRRNLNDSDRIILAEKKAESLRVLAKENQSQAGGDKKSEKSLLSQKTKAVKDPINVRKTIAKDAGVSEGTVRKHSKVMKDGSEELKAQVKSGEKKIGTAYSEVTAAEKAKKSKPPAKKKPEVTMTPNEAQALEAMAQIENLQKSIDHIDTFASGCEFDDSAKSKAKFIINACIQKLETLRNNITGTTPESTTPPVETDINNVVLDSKEIREDILRNKNPDKISLSKYYNCIELNAQKQDSINKIEVALGLCTKGGKILDPFDYDFYAEIMESYEIEKHEAFVKKVKDHKAKIERG